MLKKYLLLMILLFAGLTAYISKSAGNDSVSLSDLYPVASARNENGGLQAVPVLSNEFGVGFLLRNETGVRLYYNDDFRVDSLPVTNFHNRAGVQFIKHGNTKDVRVDWGLTPRSTGVYTFERDFFLDEGLTEFYTTLVFEFDVIGWYHSGEDGRLPADLQAWQDHRERVSLEFQIAGGASDIIVLASEVAVSRTEVVFNTANLSTQPFIHGLDYRLLVYENGWKPVPTIIGDLLFVTGFGMIMQGGEIIRDRFNFEWIYGTLANGRYMIMRSHFEDHMRPGAPRVLETLMVEFIIDDNTP